MKLLVRRVACRRSESRSAPMKMIRQAEEVVAGFAIAPADLVRRRAPSERFEWVWMLPRQNCRARRRLGPMPFPIARRRRSVTARQPYGRRRPCHADGERGDVVDRRAARRSSRHSARRSSRCRRRAPAPARRPGGSSRRASPARERAVGAHLRGVAGAGIGEDGARRDQAGLDQACRRRRAARRACRSTISSAGVGARRDRGDARRGRGDIGLLALDADEMAAEALGDGAGGAGAEERVEHDVAGLRRGEQDAVEQRLGLLRRVDLLALAVLQPLVAGADREQPVGAHLQVVVGRLQRIVVEGVALGLRVAARPDQRLMRVGEAAAAEIRHRVGLAPDHVVEDPEAEILQGGADAEDVVVGADDPERAVRLQHAAAGEQPGAGEGVVGGEARELVPVVVDRIDLATGRGGSGRPRAGDCRAGRRRPDRPSRPAAARARRRNRPSESCRARRPRRRPAERDATQPIAPPIRDATEQGAILRRTG